MTAHDESKEPSVIWRLLFAFVFLEYLNTYICVIFFTNILVYKLLFFNSLYAIIKISSKLQFFHERQNCSSQICFRVFVEFFGNCIFLLYFVASWRYWVEKTKEDQRRIAVPIFLFVIGI